MMAAAEGGSDNKTMKPSMALMPCEGCYDDGTLTRDPVWLGVEAGMHPQAQVDAQHGAHRGQEQGGGGAQHIDHTCRAGQDGCSHRGHSVCFYKGSGVETGVLSALVNRGGVAEGQAPGWEMALTCETADLLRSG